MGRPARRHHIVPAFYLRGFAKDDILSVVNLPGDHRFSQSVDNATVQNRFYSVDGHPEGEDVFERALSAVEGATSGIFRRVLDEHVWPLPPDKRETLATFITLQLLRGPAQRAQLKEIGAAVARLVREVGSPEGLKVLAARHGELISDEDAKQHWAELSAEKVLAFEASPARHISHIGALLPELLEEVKGRPWKLIRFTRRGLITSDAPVSPAPDPSLPADARVGIASASALTFPLDRRTAILLTSPAPLLTAGRAVEEVSAGVFDTVRNGSTRDERAINLSTGLSARARIYHHPNDTEYVPSRLPDPVNRTQSADEIYDQYSP